MAELTVRRATGEDLPAILELLEASMNRDPLEPYEALFHWKHVDNPFGPSPSWVATDGDRIAGFRTFMRWDFRRGDKPEVVRAVRAVDTATHPDYQGRGIFTTLTMAAIDDLRAEGIGLIFNTPNEKSRPGYLKMGWQQIGSLPTHVRVTKVGSVHRIAASRVPARIWSVETSKGTDPAVALADEAAVAVLLGSQPAGAGLATVRSAAFLRWRYGFGPLHYRAVVAPGGIADGVALFRLRERGKAVETVLADVLVPGDDATRRRALAAQAARTAGADYTLALGRRPSRGWLPLPSGPILTARALDDEAVAPLDGWDLNLGDVELF